MTPTQSQPLTPEMRSLLSALRRRIRLYVWLEGLSLAIIWIGLTFWLGLAFDYGLVRLGSGELPWAARAVFLGVIALVLAAIVYWYILRRAFVPMANHSMALLMERKFSSFRDSLVTAVELDEHKHVNNNYQDDMVADILSQAQHEIGQVQLRRIFNWMPLVRNLLVALLFLGITLGFFFSNETAFSLWANRLYGLDDRTWPRQAEIEVVDVRVSYGELPDGTESTSIAKFGKNRQLKTARGASLTMRVRANAKAPMVPRTCTIFYTNADGERGRANMRKIGDVRDGYQTYSFEDKPFRAIISDLTFDVLGYDHRLDNYSIQVVDGPEMGSLELDAVFPEYLVNEKLSQWMPRTESYRNGIQFPAGTKLTLRATMNKPIVQATIVDTTTGDEQTLELGSKGSTSLVYDIEALQGDTIFDIRLLDIDGVSSRTPRRVFIAAVEDRAPEIDVRLRGVSSAITADARIPITGTISDDYATQRAWTEVIPSNGDPEERSVTLEAGGKVDTVVDLRQLRSRDTDPLTLEPRDKLVLTVMAADRFNLAESANVGVGDRYQLDVVTPDELLAMLETRELGLRRRFEQIIEEITLTRDSLIRVQNDISGAAPRGLEPEDTREEAAPADTAGANNSDPAGDSPSEEEGSRELRLRLLRVERSIQQSQKSSQEVLGVALSFGDIREELINNRVDTEERKERLEKQIAQPLESIAKDLFPQFEAQLSTLQTELTTNNANAATTANATVDQANELVAALESVLQKMLDLETYNELVDIVRSLLEDQQKLIEATTKEQAQDVLDLLK